MGTCFLYGNGGDGFNLNLSFKNYASSSALLADTPKENTIGIVSTVAVSRWRFTSVTKPGATSPAGYVYLIASLDGDNRSSTTIPTFDPINKNNNMILLKPTGCLQLVNGSWEKMTAYIYKKNTWVQFSEIITELYLYDSGEQYTSVTGGWKATDDYTLKETYINLAVSAAYKGRQAFTLSPVDMSGYSKLNVEVTSWSKVCYLGINNTKPNDYAWNDSNFSNKTDCEAITEINANGTVSLDISSMSGSFYVWLGKPGQNTSNAEGCYITKVWLS